MSVTHTMPSPTAGTATLPRTGDLLAGRYVLTATLGEGASGIVFQARDRWFDREVAIKFLRDATTAQTECIQAFEAAHPGFARALEVGRSAHWLYLVMELIHGPELHQAITPGDTDTLVSITDQILDALAFLHARGLVHGDLKPANIRLEGQGGHLRARILDMGLARPVGFTGGGGTLAYAAPEVLAGHPIDGRADLYSLGTILYELLTGSLPFGDPQDSSYLVRALSASPSPLPSTVSPSLSAWVMRLLARDPNARYPNASEARAALHDAIPHFHSTDTVDLDQVTPRLVERDTALATITAAQEKARTGTTARVHIQGPAGSGRTQLLTHAAIRATLAGFTVITTRPHASGHQLLRNLLEEIATLPGNTHGARTLQAQASRAPLSAALLAAAETLQAAATERPLWIGIDDLDTVDEETREALAFLARGEAPIVWITTSRQEQPSPLGEETITVTLPPLSPTGVANLLTSMLPGLVETDTLATIAHAYTHGLPRHIVAGARNLQRTGALRIVSGRWRLVGDETQVATAFAVDNATEVLHTVGRLAPAHRAILAAAALSELPLDAPLLAKLADVPLHAASAAIEAGTHLGLLRRGRDGAEITSPTARETLAATLSPLEKQQIHQRALLALEGTPGFHACAARSRHAAALGDHNRAAHEALQAAEASVQSGTYRTAATWYAHARTLGVNHPSVILAHGDALARTGNLDAALQAYNEALTHGAPASEVNLRRGRALARAGRYAEAETTLANAHQDGEARFWRAWSLLHLGRYEEALQLVIPHPHDPPAIRARLARAHGTLLWHRGEPAAGREILQSALALAEQTGDRTLQAEIEMSLATALRHLGDLDGAARRYRNAIAHFRDSGDTHMLARGLNNLAITAYQAGHWDEARTGWETFADLATRLGDVGEQILANNNLGLLWKDRGELPRAASALSRAATLAHQAGLQRYEAMAKGNLAEVYTLAGELERAAETLASAETLARTLGARDELVECSRRRAAIFLARGDYHHAHHQALEAAEQARTLGATLERGNALLIATAAARALGHYHDARTLLEQARQALEAAGTRIERARADLEGAELAAAEGEYHRARELAAQAARVFAEVGAARELATAQALERGAGSSRGDVARELAAAVAGSNSADTMLERVLDRLLALTGAERGFVVLLESETGPRLAAARHVDGTTEPIPRLSASIAERVIASRKPLVLADVGEHADLACRASVVALGLRAALAAPLMRGEHCLGLLYIDSRRNPADLARWGLWPLEIATALVAPVLDLLLARERERDRVQLLRDTAERLLDAMPTIDAALQLVAEEDNPSRRATLARQARHRCAALVTQADAVLELLRHDGTPIPPASDGVDVSAIIRYTLDGCETDNVITEIAPALPPVRAEPVTLARVLSQVIEVASAGRTRPVTLRAYACDDDGRGAVLGWRPGQGEVHSRVHVVAEPTMTHEQQDPPRDPIETGRVVLRTAQRALIAWGANLWIEPSPRGPTRIVLDLTPMTETPNPTRRAS